MTKEQEVVAEFAKVLEGEMEAAEATLGNKAVRRIKDAFKKGARDLSANRFDSVISGLQDMAVAKEAQADMADNLVDAAACRALATILDGVVRFVAGDPKAAMPTVPQEPRDLPGNTEEVDV